MISSNALFTEQCDVVVGLAPIAPSTSTPDYVSLKNYERCCILIAVDNGSGVTGSAITVKQASAVAGTGEKALSFATALRNVDVGAADGLASFAVTSDTFTTATTTDKNLLYAVEVRADQLDVANGFDCIRAGTGDSVNAVVCVLYILFPKRYSVPGSAIID